jgi:tRNA threonylcarbamoyladenosine biosynthesis protein TsaE
MPIAIKNDKTDLSSEKQTEELALKFLNKLKPGNKVFLYGEMGVGKTTFVRYLINGFQKKHKLILTEVTSPTFNLLSEYSINNLTIKHYDLYRLKNEREIDSLGLFEEEPDSIILVEWPEIVKRDLKNLIKLYFSYENDYQKRFVQIKGLDL